MAHKMPSFPIFEVGVRLEADHDSVGHLGARSRGQGNAARPVTQQPMLGGVVEPRVVEQLLGFIDGEMKW